MKLNYFDSKPPEEDFDQFLANDSNSRSADGSCSLGRDQVDQESEDEKERDANPMVAHFKEEIDSEDGDNQSKVQSSETEPKFKINERFSDLDSSGDESEKKILTDVTKSTEIPASCILVPSYVSQTSGVDSQVSDSVLALSSHDFDFLESMALGAEKSRAVMESFAPLTEESRKKKKSKSNKEGSEDTVKSRKSKKKKSKDEKGEKKKKSIDRSDSDGDGELVSVKQDEDYEEL